MESILQWPLSAILVGVLTFGIIQLIIYFISSKAILKELKGLINVMDTNIDKVVEMLQHPEDYDIGNKATNKNIEKMLEELHEMNRALFRLITIVERNGSIIRE